MHIEVKQTEKLGVLSKERVIARVKQEYRMFVHAQKAGTPQGISQGGVWGGGVDFCKGKLRERVQGT